MATKKKKEAEDFEMPNAEDLDLLRQERAGSATRVAQFNKDFVPTGSAFKDTGVMSGTSRDVKRTREIDALFSKAADRQATTRGQDMEFTSQSGVTDMNLDRNRIMEKGGDQSHELGMGELNLNKDIFTATKDRYTKYGETADILNLAEKAAGVQEGVDLLGYGMQDEAKNSVNRFIKNDSVAKPTNTLLDESQTMYNKVPDSRVPNSDSFLGSVFNSDKFQSATATGLSAIDNPLANLDDFFGIPNRVAKQRAIKSSMRRKVKKVQ